MKHLLLRLLLIFTNRGDIYPAKKPKHEKTKIKSQGRKDIDVSADKYAEIIDDFPTYHRNK